jgi:hypothetical protein
MRAATSRRIPAAARTTMTSRPTAATATTNVGSLTSPRL